MNPIFKDIELQQQFETEGYVTIPLLNEAQVRDLTALFHQFHPHIAQNQFESSTYLNDTAYKLKIRDTLYPIFHPALDRIFRDYIYIGSAFLYKTPGNRSDVAPHQDWTIVDEKKHVAINIWTTLVDADERNGTLYVLPRSQSTEIFAIRAPTIPFFYQAYLEDVIKCLRPIPTKAGHAVILNQSLIHYSPPNRSDTIRIAITTGIKSAGAGMVFHFRDEQEPEKLSVYQVSEDFLSLFKNFHEDIYKRPENAKLTGMIEYSPPKITRQEFLKRFGTARKSWWRRVLGVQ